MLMSMSDPYIDQYETLSYGPFTVRQVRTLIIGMDAHFDPLLQHLTTRLENMNTEMSQALDRSGGLETATYKPAEKGPDPVAEARDVIERLGKYLQSRRNGEQLIVRWLGRQTPAAASRRRPAKLLGTLKQAQTLLEDTTVGLGEAATWKDEITLTHSTLEGLDQRVRGARLARREMSPEVRDMRGAWLLIYGALKLVVEAALRLHGRLELMPEVFDDLAEIHRVPGVSDGPSEEKPTTPPTTPSTPPTRPPTAPVTAPAPSAAAPIAAAVAPPPATATSETAAAGPSALAPAPAPAAASPAAEPAPPAEPANKPPQGGAAKAPSASKRTKK